MTIPIMAAAVGLSTLVPSIVKWLNGNDGPNVAETVVEIAKAITKTGDSTDAINTIKNDSTLLLEFQKKVIAIEASLESDYLKDRASARDRDIAIQQTSSGNKRADIMVISAAAGLVICLLSLSFYSGTLPGEAVGIISTIAGIFGSCLKDAYTFEFGSSRGSKEKDITVAEIIKKTSPYHF